MSSYLLIIDAQNQFLCPRVGGRFAKKHRPITDIVDAIQHAVTAARQAHHTIIWITSEYDHSVSLPSASVDTPRDVRTGTHRGRTPCCVKGSEACHLFPGVATMVREGDVQMTKSWYSSFRETDLLQYLTRDGGCCHVRLCGVHTNVCVMATALDARLLLPPETIVEVFEPATGAFSANQHERASNQMREAGVLVRTKLDDERDKTQEFNGTDPLAREALHEHPPKRLSVYSTIFWALCLLLVWRKSAR